MRNQGNNRCVPHVVCAHVRRLSKYSTKPLVAAVQSLPPILARLTWCAMLPKPIVFSAGALTCERMKYKRKEYAREKPSMSSGGVYKLFLPRGRSHVVILKGQTIQEKLGKKTRSVERR